MLLAHTGTTIRDAEGSGGGLMTRWSRWHGGGERVVLTHLNPMTYAVEPMRSVVFDHLQVDPATRATFDPGISWNHWQVPVGVQVVLVVAVSVVFLGVAVARFTRTE